MTEPQIQKLLGKDSRSTPALRDLVSSVVDIIAADFDSTSDFGRHVRDTILARKNHLLQPAIELEPPL